MAGAHYRARGNVPAAVAVITSMIQVMTDVGMDRSQLKPALLLLASCHFDIAKQLRQQSTKTMESKFHFDIACEYLRDVYGTFVPPASTVQHYQHPACSSTVVHTTASPKADGPDSPQAQRTSNRMFSPEPTLQYSQVRTLGLEIQSHRDGGETMGHTRSTKRRLEEGLETEKRVRRKLEYGPKATEYSVCGVNEASEPVPDQRRVETATPLCAEDHVEETRQGVADPQTSLEPRVAEHVVWDKKFKDFFSKLGVVFLRAARGDLGEVLSG
ncbi:hypothetical protein C8Q79DRAFT_910980 [Trametes meyenii]|nr:hypothetical protein C8Q79DRAFT_910980 [Trametes meyenii]